MFSHLTDFSYTRNWKGAVGFYLAFMLLGLLGLFIIGVAGAIINPPPPGASYADGFQAGVQFGMHIGIILITLYSLAISFVVLFKKNLQKRFWYVLLALVSGIAALFGGALLGLIIPAFLTTRTNL